MLSSHGKRRAQTWGREARRAETRTRFTTDHPRRGTPNRRGGVCQRRRPCYEDFSMRMTDDDDTVYCDVQMPLAQGRELLLLVTTLRESNAHPTLNRVFERMQRELNISIDIIENPPSWAHGASESNSPAYNPRSASTRIPRSFLVRAFGGHHSSALEMHRCQTSTWT